VDVTVLRLLNGTKVYVHAVIDNYSRRILAYCVSERFEIANAVAVLAEAAKKAVTAGGKPMLVVDAGIENFNKGVDALIDEGVLTRVLALTDLRFSNSLIERFWNSAKSQWLFLNDLDSVAAVRRLFAFYVTAHNTEIPHSAHRGQTPDEMYFGTGAEVPEKLAAGMKEAQAARLVKNRKVACGECSGFRTPNDEVVVAAAAA
jgi:transposase InsO family protein